MVCLSNYKKVKNAKEQSNKQDRGVIQFILLGVLVLSACAPAPTPAPAPTEDVAAIQTQSAATVYSDLTASAPTAMPTCSRPNPRPERPGGSHPDTCCR